jgi:hypothetical protein
MERRVVNCRFAAGDGECRAPLRVATATVPRDDDLTSDEDDDRAAVDKRVHMTIFSVQLAAVGAVLLCLSLSQNDHTRILRHLENSSIPTDLIGEVLVI